MSDTRDTQWFPRLGAGDAPLYLRIADALAVARQEGEVQPGDRLPPQREIARRLGVDLTTVSRAFAEARRRNLIEATTGRGTFISARGTDDPILDLEMNIPPTPAGVSLPSLIREGLDGLLKRSSAEALLSYHPGPGSFSERAAGSLWLSKGGERLSVEQVVVGAGAQMLLTAVVMACTCAGDTMLTDTLTYPGFIALAGAADRQIATVESDEQGMRPDSLDEQARKTGARLVYLNPTLHNPTTLIMPEERRAAIADVARKNGLLIIEDDPYSVLLSDPPVSFLVLAPDLTLHIATLAKCVSPFLRTAFLATRSVDLLDSIAVSLRGMSLMAAPLMTGLAADWIRSGQAMEIVEGIRQEANARVGLAKGIMPEGFLCQPAGLHGWMPLRESAAGIVEKARRKGIAVSASRDFAPEGAVPEALRIALGAAPTRARLTEGLEALGRIMSGKTERGTAIV